MYHFIGQIFERENCRTGSNVAFLEPVAFVNAVLGSHEGVTSDVEFAFVVK